MKDLETKRVDSGGRKTLPKKLIVLLLAFVPVLIFSKAAWGRDIMKNEFFHIVIQAFEDYSWLKYDKKEDHEEYFSRIYIRDKAGKIAAGALEFKKNGTDWHTITRVKKIVVKKKIRGYIVLEVEVVYLGLMFSRTSRPVYMPDGKGYFQVELTVTGDGFRISEIAELKYKTPGLVGTHHGNGKG